MTGRQIVETYSQSISSRYRRYGWTAGIIGAFGIFIHAWFDPIPVFGYFISIMIGLGIGFMVYTLNHRYQLLFHFNKLNPDAFERLEKYLLEKREGWDKTYMLRLGMMSILMITMLLFLFFSKDIKWAAITAALFIGFVLALIIRGWLDFNDEILLHDIRRSIRDQTSE
jgi:uncharacterized membrane protein YczE